MKNILFLSVALLSTSLYSSISQEGCPPDDDDDTSGLCPEISQLPNIGISQRQVQTIALDDYVSDADNDLSELTYDIDWTGFALYAEIDATTRTLTLTGSSSNSGEVELTLTVTDPEGCSTGTSFFVKVHETRSCSYVFSYDAGEFGSKNDLHVAGQFNDWDSTATAMTDPDGDGVYTSEALTISPGWVQYKLVSDGGANWFQDPGNPYKAWDGDFENSEVKIPDCNQPAFSLVEAQAEGSGIRAEVYVQDGFPGYGIDEDSISVTAGGLPAPATYDDYERTISLRLTGLSPDKYSLRFNAASQDGTAAELLYVPLWVESTPFTWDDAVIYFAMTDRFEDGDSSNNDPNSSVPDQSNYQGGDWEGITQKIEAGYFDDLGVNAIWLTPVLNNTENAEYGEDGRLYTGYHGYWPTSDSQTESHFGTLQELRDLISAAHSHGIRVLFDLVANHVHNQHPYYTEHHDEGWFNDYALCRDDDNWNDIPLTCWFEPFLPDLNFRNPDALHTLTDDALSYINDFDIDAYRVDAVKHVELAYLYHLSADITNYVEHNRTEAENQFYLVGETFTGEWSYSCDNTANCPQWLINSFVGDELLDGQFDFPLYWEMLTTFARYESSMSDLAYLLSQSKDYYGDTATMSPFLGNHDVARFISHANGDIYDQWGNGAKEQGWSYPPNQPTDHQPYQQLQLAFSFLASLHGAPLLYYGDEIGLAGAGDPDNRRMMGFDSELSTYQAETLAHAQTVFSLRAEHPAMRSNSRLMLVGTDPDVMVIGKLSPADKAMTALNRSGSTRTVTVNVSGMGYSDGQELTDALSGSTVAVSGSSVVLSIPPYSSAIYF